VRALGLSSSDPAALPGSIRRDLWLVALWFAGACAGDYGEKKKPSRAVPAGQQERRLCTLGVRAVQMGATAQAAAPMTSVDDAELLARDLRRWVVNDAVSPNGGVFAWVDHHSGQPAYEYPEISGYALTHFAGSPLQGDDLRLEGEAGVNVASWLEKLVNDERLAAKEGWDGQAVYNFDIAMMANGMMTFGLRFGHDRFVECGLKLASRLVAQVGRHGYLPAIDDHISPVSQRSAWSTQGFSHLIKPAQCLSTAAGLGLAGAGDAASAVVAKGLAGQGPDGHIETRVGDEAVMLHPHLYGVEGLWVHGKAVGDEATLERARQAVEWAHRQILPTGGFPRYVNLVDGSVGPEQFDLTAQLVRAVLLLDLDVDLTATVERLSSVSLQVPGKGRAIPYQTEQEVVHRNAWATMFAAQALELYSSRAGSSLEWRHLV